MRVGQLRAQRAIKAQTRLAAPEAKVSAAGAVVSTYQVGRPTWMKQDAKALAEEGYSKCSIVFACVSLIASAFGSIPWCLYKGKKELEDPMHPLIKLNDFPNPLRTGAEYREDAAAFLLIQGDSFLESVGPNDESAPPIEMWLHRPDQTEVIAGPFGMPSAYRYTNGSASKTWAFDPIKGGGPIIHWKTFSPLDHWRGMSPIRAAAYGVDQHNEAGAHNKALLENGGRPSGALVYKPEGMPGAVLTPDQKRDLRRMVDEKLSGPGNAGYIPIWDGGLEWISMGLNPVDMDWLEGKSMSAREICNIYRVPPQLVGVPGESTFNNMETARLMLYEDVVIPLARKYRDKINQRITPKFGEDLRLELDLDEIPALAPRRTEKWAQINTATFLTTNEKREALDYEKLDSPEGDLVLIPSSLAPLDGIADPPEAPADQAVDPETGKPIKPKPGEPKPKPGDPKPKPKPTDEE
jgi:HK97 family phage portal protein